MANHQIDAIDPDWTGPRDGEGYPIRNAIIHGVPALVILDVYKGGVRMDQPLSKAIFNGEEITTVKSAEEIAKAMQDQESIHVCPLCEDGFLGYEALRIHAPDCVEARAPRRHIFLPPGTPGAVTDYSKMVRDTD